MRYLLELNLYRQRSCLNTLRIRFLLDSSQSVILEKALQFKVMLSHGVSSVLLYNETFGELEIRLSVIWYRFLKYVLVPSVCWRGIKSFATVTFGIPIAQRD
jgi:hypothetical protein